MNHEFSTTARIHDEHDSRFRYWMLSILPEKADLISSVSPKNFGFVYSVNKVNLITKFTAPPKHIAPVWLDAGSDVGGA